MNDPKKSDPRHSLSTAITHEAIARRAYEIWERDGCVDGRAEQHWLEAVRETHGPTADGGNPANLSLPARERLVAERQGSDEPVNVPPGTPGS
jgi:Protein of unknown function (DUF2934)